MIEIKKKDECCGCYGCSNICPKNCIDMKVDNEGFWYPEVDMNKCIECNLCEKVCPVINDLQKQSEKITAYACKNKDEQIRLNSSSGGIFTLLCEEVINKGGVVFGACFDENFNVKHTYAETLEECVKFRGSKYVQSSIGFTYKEVKKFLDSGRTVLFTGTQCQIKGLNLYLRKSYNNLISVDVICHGVPSPKVFNAYKNKLVSKYGGQITDIKFRDKTKGWKEFSYVTRFKNGKIHSKTLKEDIYIRGFLNNLYLRPSCYSCKAKNFTNNSDLSLADYWGVQDKHREFDDNKGVSLVLINSKKGKRIFNLISNKLEVLETDLEYAILCNPCIIKPVEINNKREDFFKEFKEERVIEVINKYSKLDFILGFKIKLVKIINKIKYT